ncbi:uncharacterized protein MONBRDRAFT_28269 [Monosiga brevicollis MX1]|uniref:RecQ mediated genome instability protein 1 OB-fold domain-containing protein n=1 Tax=Monosiga brevicollis TaxID=81824 RepID=A9V7N9_MONBE|nr:uncharacterized protein MONBRDRAFT_28269 [Monosiga brevicollis MX1]EDQ86337.1 predicted protein [Monosiga brevicollis MX1]|eukprot:XP_001748727.1 hypothetical protein [Monosiga brevicollis MX1]
MTKLRVCIIGAGPSGLSALIAFAKLQAAGEEIPELVCYDKQSDWGGLWNYTWRTGLDEHGEPVHGSMYRYLWSNGPKECLEFADYSFDEHYGQQIPSFPPREVLADYVLGRAKKHQIRDYIRFAHAVRNVEFDAETATFAVTVEDLTSHTRSTSTFDRVICAGGHFSTPNAPYFPGLERFPGRVLHAHDFRDALEFKDRRILIVGASYSAEDIGLQLHKYGARQVSMSYRTAAQGFAWPEGMEEIPLLEKLEGNTAHFQGGITREVDAVILCTGYQHVFPYLADNLRLRTTNRLCPPNLYKGVVWHDNTQLYYLGMQDQWYTFTMFDAQAYLARDLIMGRRQLPDAEARAKDMEVWAKREIAAETGYQQIDYQTDYVRDLLVKSDYPTFDLDACADMFKAWKGHKKESIVGYRDHAFKSPVTGTMAPVHHTPWLQAMDDSLTCFMGNASEQAIMEATRQRFRSLHALVDDAWLRAATQQHVNALLDVSQSAYSQLEEAERVAERRRGVDTTLDSDEPAPSISNTRANRILKIKMTDGLHEIKGVEIKPLPQLQPAMTPGCKLQVAAGTPVVRNLLLLEPGNTKVLGGQVPALEPQSGHLAVLRACFGIEPSETGAEPPDTRVPASAANLSHDDTPDVVHDLDIDAHLQMAEEAFHQKQQHQHQQQQQQQQHQNQHQGQQQQQNQHQGQQQQNSSRHTKSGREATGLPSAANATLHAASATPKKARHLVPVAEVGHKRQWFKGRLAAFDGNLAAEREGWRLVAHFALDQVDGDCRARLSNDILTRIIGFTAPDFRHQRRAAKTDPSLKAHLKSRLEHANEELLALAGRLRLEAQPDEIPMLVAWVPEKS